jgi:hypothetical protein
MCFVTKPRTLKPLNIKAFTVHHVFRKLGPSKGNGFTKENGYTCANHRHYTLKNLIGLRSYSRDSDICIYVTMRNHYTR